MPYVSVIVPAYNAAATLPLCLAALAAQDYPREEYEIIVVDDGSTDATAEKASAAGVRVISQPNAGPAAARNRGAEAARGELLLFTDADCAPTPGWLRALTVALSEEGVAGAKGTYLTRQREPVARLTQQEYQDRYDRMAGMRSIDFVDTYSAGYHKDLFLANGGFDTGFPTASVEDQEFSFRLAARGYRLVFAPAGAGVSPAQPELARLCPPQVPHRLLEGAGHAPLPAAAGARFAHPATAESADGAAAGCARPRSARGCAPARCACPPRWQPPASLPQPCRLPAKWPAATLRCCPGCCRLSRCRALALGAGFAAGVARFGMGRSS